MQIRLIAIGTRLPSWINTGYQDYAKRLNQSVKLQLVELEGVKRRGSSTATVSKAIEAKQIIKHIKKGQRVIVLDQQGQSWTTLELSVRLAFWLQSGQDISLVIGGADGLAKPCLECADEIWSLSPLTFPHALVRVIVAEQLYRAWSVLQAHPYHRK